MVTVNQDANSGWYLPESSTQWTEYRTWLPSGTLSANPAALWKLQETTGTLADSIGSNTLTNTSFLYFRDVAGWTRKAMGYTVDGHGSTLVNSTTIGNITTTSHLLFAIISLPAPAPSTNRTIMGLGSGTSHRYVELLTDGKLRVNGNGGSASVTGSHSYLDRTFPIFLHVNRSAGVCQIVTDMETLVISPYLAPAGGSFLLNFGPAVNLGPKMEVLYASCWTGSSAESVDESTLRLMLRMMQEGPPTTRAAMAAGGTKVMKLVVAIEGCPFLISDAPSAAVLTAWRGVSTIAGGFPASDWSQVLPGLFVQLTNDQSLDLFDPFTKGGSCQVRVIDTDHTDVFGKLVAKRYAGAETSIFNTLNTTAPFADVKQTGSFPSPGECHIGTECIGYSVSSGTELNLSVRGKYSPFSNGNPTVDSRFANHHRVGFDPNQVQLNPVVSQYSRMWVGKRIGIWMHTWDGTALNSRAHAQLMYAGRIADIADDKNNFHTVINCKHVLDEVSDATIGRQLWSGTIAPGLWLPEGRRFQFQTWKDDAAGWRKANDLVVVTSGASGANQMNEGFYSLQELVEVINKWVAAEAIATRINGNYSFASPVTSNVGLRTKCYWYVNHASKVLCNFQFGMPAEVMGFLGLQDVEPSTSHQMLWWNGAKGGSSTNTENRSQGDAVPYHTVVYRPLSPARLANEFSEATNYDMENEKGTWINQREMLPAAVKDNCPAGHEWGFFLLDEKLLMVGSMDPAVGRLTNCWIAPFQLTADTETDALPYIGRRVDDPGEPITVRQVLVLESSLEFLLNSFFYNTGTTQYNHSVYDVLGYGLGIGIPGELLGEPFERSVAQLPGVQAPMVVIIDEPTKLSEIIGADLLLRRAFLRFKNGHLEIAQWKTPTATDAVATLDETNKYVPPDQVDNNRIASQETSEFQRPVIKIDYSRDFSIGKGNYQKSVLIEDQVAVDDMGGNAKPFTLKMRNIYSQFTNAGSAVEALIPPYISMLPAVSRTSRKIIRPIGLPHFEELSIGDAVIVDDEFARDPLTGARGILSRPALVTSINYDIGGSSFDGGKARNMSGDAELMFMDFHRGKPYSYAARVDDTATNAGYNAGTFSLTCYPHSFSEENAQTDATRFRANDKVYIVQEDPADPAAPIFWERTVSTTTGNLITLTAAISSPSWDTSKRYYIFPNKWSLATATQRDQAFQADDADEMIEDTEVPYHYVVSEEHQDVSYAVAYNTNFDWLAGPRNRPWTPNHTMIAELPEFTSTLTHGDGKSLDVGTDRKNANLLNRLIDYQTAHQNPFLWRDDVQLTGTYGTWTSVMCIPVFMGTEQLTTSVFRQLTVAPWYRSHSGASASIRLTLTRQRPTGAPGTGNALSSASFIDHFSQATWTTTSTTWQTGTDAVLSLSVKDLHFGHAWLIVEKLGAANFRGIAKINEGPRRII